MKILRNAAISCNLNENRFFEAFILKDYENNIENYLHSFLSLEPSSAVAFTTKHIRPAVRYNITWPSS